MTTLKNTEELWELIYWPGVKGRGEYVRLVFEEAGVPYVDVAVKGAPESQNPEGMQSVIDFTWKGGNTGFPVRAPPAIRRGDFVLSNTPVVMAYLGRQFGLMPDGLEDAAHVEQVLAVVTDAVAEGRLAFHPKDFYASHKTQVEESKPYIKQYGESRLPKYLQYWEALLEGNPDPQASRKLAGSSSFPGFLIGGSVTVADLAVYHKRIASRPRIQAYLQSDRCPPWDNDSMM
ncbi:hypothetical protein VOLCADRAFT_95137 [Volvox carteri f. nagariensis]|uniref:GST N-terminal domain-containing protein n=1 Tax=Volvox carteri f. nagariensis TaxID=3068 RepID=D8U6P8_VOLCA|nr:uncharacterized protein VOLCADRAFT_95137 [Volvox carteri f. nagariensis]EFJ44478.1 hypothetical protein VOLCADRAFT_95137 [Volvox carteri f. nagariensis]|eukprot:XP_002954328.1 hypothetical protein VOLCADRAFT_95137 [Volvox carteri f. nagariensis]